MSKATYLGSKELNALLPKDTAERFRIVKIEKLSSPRVVFPQYGEIDFRTLTVTKAQSLIEKKCNFIEVKAPKSDAK